MLIDLSCGTKPGALSRVFAAAAIYSSVLVLKISNQPAGVTLLFLINTFKLLDVWETRVLIKYC